VLHPSLRQGDRGASAVARAPQARLDEAVGLARAINLHIVHAALMPVRQWRPATLLGTGAVDDICAPE